MTDRTGIFAGDDPFVIARDWLAEASKTEPNDANAIALATVDAEGLPDVRMVLLKEIEGEGETGGRRYGLRFNLGKAGVKVLSDGWTAVTLAQC